MAITKDGGRQWPLYAKVDFTVADLTTTVAEPAVTLPAGATVVGGHLAILTAFSGGGVGETVQVAGGGASTAAVDADAGTSFTALTLDGTATTAVTDITVTWTGTATAGAGQLVVAYVMDGRANEVQPV